jgi:hypothetical protein
MITDSNQVRFVKMIGRRGSNMASATASMPKNQADRLNGKAKKGIRVIID